MGGEWQQVKLDNIARIEMGQSPPGETCNYYGDGLPLLNGPTEFGGHHPVPAQFTTEPKKLALPKDVLFCVRGSTTGRMNWADRKYAIGRGIAALRHRAGSEYQHFLRATLEYHLDELLAGATGSTFPNVSRDQLAKLLCNVPSLPEQRIIARILGALDDKIELNRCMNVSLEAMSYALFNEWFLVNPEAEGWDILPLPEIIEVNPSRSLRKGDIAPYLDMANMPTQGHRAIQWVDRPFGSGTKFTNGDTLLARITPCLENGKTAFVDFLSEGQIGWGSTEYIILRPKPPVPPEYGYYLARSDSVRNHAIQNMTGTSGRQRTPASCFDTFEISVPPVELAIQFGDFARSIMGQIRANDEQSRTLAVISNTLLPKLMSGEIQLEGFENEI